MDVTWVLKPFAELSAAELYDLLVLRQRVFVVEQNCAFQEADGVDPQARHLMGYAEGALVACARLVPAGVKHAERSIGRVATAPETRGRGLGRVLMEEAIARCLSEDPRAPIRLGAQLYLADGFYASLGFRRIGEVYDEDGIAHVDMILQD